MIKATKGICKVCAAGGDHSLKWIVNKTHVLCQYHNQLRLHGKPKHRTQTIKKRRYSETFNYCTRWGFTKEMEMFKSIWETRPHVSFFTGRPVYFHPAHFMHVLPKGLNKYPHYRLNPDNIVLGNREEHHLADMGTEAQREAYKKKYPNYSFEHFKQLEERLKQAYNKEFTK